MTEGTFNIAIDMLVSATRPYRWTNDSRNAYWKVFYRVDDEVFMSACNRMISQSEEMPSIPALMKEIGVQKVQHQDCPKCDGGRVNYVIHHEKRDLDYPHRYAACDCEAGDAVLQHIVNMAKRSAQANGRLYRARDPEDYRWATVRERLRSRIRHESPTPVARPEEEKSPAMVNTEASERSKAAFNALIGD